MVLGNAESRDTSRSDGLRYRLKIDVVSNISSVLLVSVVNVPEFARYGRFATAQFIQWASIRGYFIHY